MQTKKAHAPKHKKRTVVVAVIAGVILVLAAVFFAYTGSYYHADASAWSMAEAYAVSMEQKDGYMAIAPRQGAPTTGYVFYPGGKVQAEAYLPYLAQVAQQGYYCALLQLPFRLAVFDMDAAATPIGDNPGISVWAVGGHSLGGVAAAGFAGGNTAAVQGLVLLAAYPGGDISQTELAVLSVTATQDGVLNREKWEQAKENLPPGTEYGSIEGGNHGQFGLYGPQKNNGKAYISPQTQQEQVAAATANLLGRLHVSPQTAAA